MAGFHDEDGSSKQLLHHNQLKSNYSSKIPKEVGSETINIKKMTRNELHPSTSCGNTFMDKALLWRQSQQKERQAVDV